MRRVKTRCDICGHTGCSLIITIESNNITKIEGDKDDPRTNGKICTQALAIKDILNSKKRLTHPLLKTKNNEWKQVSWNDALEKIATKLTTLKEKHGPKSIAFATGYYRSYSPTVNTYIDQGIYYISVKIKDVWGLESDWSPTAAATIGECCVSVGDIDYNGTGPDIADLVLNWDGIERSPENVVEHQGLLRWTFISLAWGGALGEHLGEAQKLNAQAEAAQKAGDTQALKETLSKLAKLAARLLVQHGFVTEDGTPAVFPEGPAGPSDR